MGDFDIFVPALHKPSALLPIARHKDALLYTIVTHPVTVLLGQTGSGKTTQLPQYLAQSGWCDDGKVIAITQPRRVAAMTVAKRVAAEMGCELGREVGYSIRFDDKTSAATKIKFMTDGMLLREALVDPKLDRYSVIMIDEAHERGLSSDILLGLLKRIRSRLRPELKIIVSSATLQAEHFLQFFAEDEETTDPKAIAVVENVGSIISIEGRAHPVDIHYLTEPCDDYLQRAVQTIFDIHMSEPSGDILLFLTGMDEIQSAMQMISDRIPEMPNGFGGILSLPLYSGLPKDQQMLVFEQASNSARKVICATNIAEASVTIDGIVYVIDCGFVKLRAYNPKTGIETLTPTPISKASAIQRAGRAGRSRPGKCYRLYTEDAFDSLENSTVPEIQRSNLAPVILQLKALGVENIARFDFITPPPSVLVVRALDLLYSLKALDEYARLTKPLGEHMAELGALEPMLAKCLLSAAQFNCLPEMLSIAAMLSLQGGVWLGQESKRAEATTRRKFAVEEGDHLTLLNVYQAFTKAKKDKGSWCRMHGLHLPTMEQAVKIRNQLQRQLERFGIDVSKSLAGHFDVLRVGGRPQEESIRRCLTSGFFAHSARMLPDGTFATVDGSTILHAHPSSLMFNRKADWVIFSEIEERGEKTFIKDVTKIEKAWLLEYAAEFYRIRQPGGEIITDPL